MPSNCYRGPPMTLANMRAQAVRSLWVVCELCHHEAVMNVDRYGDAVPVPAFGPWMVCTYCGSAHARPNWQARVPSEKPDGQAVAVAWPAPRHRRYKIYAKRHPDDTCGSYEFVSWTKSPPARFVHECLGPFQGRGILVSGTPQSRRCAMSRPRSTLSCDRNSEHCQLRSFFRKICAECDAVHTLVTAMGVIEPPITAYRGGSNASQCGRGNCGRVHRVCPDLSHSRRVLSPSAPYLTP